jgi:hypothetical protein
MGASLSNANVYLLGLMLYCFCEQEFNVCSFYNNVRFLLAIRIRKLSREMIMRIN